MGKLFENMDDFVEFQIVTGAADEDNEEIDEDDE